MGTDFVYDPRSSFAGQAEAVCIRYLAELNAADQMIAPANLWWDKYTRRNPGAALVTRVFIPVQGFRPTPWTGSVVFSGTSSVFFDVTRGISTLGVKEKAMKIAEMDFGAFNLSPVAMNKAIDKMPQQGFAAAVNAGYTTLDWTGTPFFRKTAVKPNSPGKPAFGKFLNAFENSALTPANIKRSIVNIQTRKGFDGLLLDLEPMDLMVPWSQKEIARDYVEVMQLIPSTDGTSSGGGNTSTVYGRLKVVAVPEMRDDMWIVAAPTDASHMKPFIYTTGGGGGGYTANEDPLKSGSGVPHIITIPHLTDSEMYRSHLEMGIAMIINEGYALQTPHALCANYLGAAS